VARSLVAPASAGTLRCGASLAWIHRSGSAVPDHALGALAANGTGALFESVYVDEDSTAPTQPFSQWIDTELSVDPNPSPSASHNAFGNALVGARRRATSFDDLAIGAPRADSGSGIRAGLVYVSWQ
jgi:hypothetical protein